MHFTIGLPQLIYLALAALGLIVCAAKHGQPSKGEYNVVTLFFAQMLVLALLWWGGFFG